MGFATPIHHHTFVQIPLRLVPVIIPRVPAISLSFSSSVHRHASSSCSYHFSVRERCLARRFSWMPAAGGTKREDRSVSEEMQSSDPQVLNELRNSEESVPSSFRTVGLWVCAAVSFGVALGFKDGAGKASEFFAGYILEQSLSVDNLFVFVLVFKYFQVPKEYQNRVLSYGIAGAIIFRAVIILLGTATIQRFEAVNILLALILLYSSYKLFSSEDDDNDLSDNFIVKTCQKFIPVTDYYDGDRFLTVQEGVWKPAIGIVLGFIGTKMIFDFFGFHVSTEASLGIVATTIGTGVVLSLLKKSD